VSEDPKYDEKLGKLLAERDLSMATREFEDKIHAEHWELVGKMSKTWRNTLYATYEQGRRDGFAEGARMAREIGGMIDHIGKTPSELNEP
jgi:hypothetical protein